MRLLDLTFWESMAPITAKLLGTAVSEAFVPAKQMRLSWSSESKYPDGESAYWKIVVVLRADYSVIVGTPLCSLGKAPVITLPKCTTALSLGEAVLTQAQYSAARYKKTECTHGVGCGAGS